MERAVCSSFLKTLAHGGRDLCDRDKTAPPPTVVFENLAHPFQFYWSGGIAEGIRYGQEIYSLSQEFSLQASLKAWHLANHLLSEGLPILVTVSEIRCAIWVNLKATTQIHN